MILEGARRTIGKPPSQQKEPISMSMAKELVQRYGNDASLVQRRTVVLYLLGFASFFRISELVGIQVMHLKFGATHLEITVPKAKNDQQREGHVVFIARSHSNECPVRQLRRYLDDTGLEADGGNYVFSRLAKTKSGHRAIGTKPLSDKTLRELFNSTVAPICDEVEPGAYCLHSLRSGGASSASNDRETREVEVRLVKGQILKGQQGKEVISL